MASKLSTFIVGHGWRGLSCNNPNERPPSLRLIRTSCKMQKKNISSPNKRQPIRKVPPERLLISNNFEPNDDQTAKNETAPTDVTTSSPEILIPMNENYDETAAVQSAVEDSVSRFNKGSMLDNEVEVTFVDKVNNLARSDDSSHLAWAQLSTENVDGGEKLSTVRLDDLVGMIRNSEKNIMLLNQARIRALEELDKTVTEKESLQGEMNVLEMKLAETDARMKVAAQAKIHAEHLEHQLERLKDELSDRGVSEENYIDVTEDNNELLTKEALMLQNRRFTSLSEELRSLRKENIFLKDDIQKLKEELTNVKETDYRVLALENERSSLDAALKDLESKLVVAQEDVAKLSILKFECKDLWDKVGSLQKLLDKTTKQANQAISLLQQNSELRKKVDRLEESLEEASVYKLSSEKLNKYNELMQQKIQIMEERLQKSDREIHSHVQLYQESVMEFQDILNSLKEESKKRAVDEPMDDLPWIFWSCLLLKIDGWFLEKKISFKDAKLLREMAWKRDRRIHNAYMDCNDKIESEVLSTFLKLISSESRSTGLHIIHIAAEMAPVAKVGGLGDVVSGLSKALQKKGHLVEVILPKYDCMQNDRIGDMRALDMVLESYFEGRLFKNKVWVGTVEGLPVYFIEPLHPAKFFWRGQFYGEHDDFKRFSYFSRAALELILQAGKKPDIIHCHDWQTAFVAPLYWDLYAPKGLNSARICFTCHNFEYQGTSNASELGSCGLDVHQLNRPDRMQDHSAHDRVNPVKGAVVFSNIVTTVSPTYAQEVRSVEGGRGLHSTINSHSKKFVGILNGIDTDAWDPSSDTFLKVQYNADDLQGKVENKKALREELKLSSADSRQPLVGCITRLVPQKGVHLIRHAIYRTLELGGQFVLLGSSPVDHIQREFEGIAKHFQNHPHVRLILKYDEALSHSIYAASDMFIIPSIFEPCGLTQMIAMRFGSVPIVRKTGGLNDSVFDVDDDSIPAQLRNGFTFVNQDEKALSSALDRAYNLYTMNNQKWQQLVQRNMKIDFSWDSSASEYIELYEKSVARARVANRALPLP
ncbi:probable starch synthase 4, chloroplastic/amyloplastic isoform X2 [Papaver somniferum]|uniref:probable starch synthase 4, chloroplastic/amyloplastic isoform X2 n=1 Tax=Papaver somniferum TaxID=3469 RepID=UPI000E7012E2|nr:probable starch synthase 4, chloroplastic/amyloplastic isoform X2 [Papaver somniferum]